MVQPACILGFPPLSTPDMEHDFSDLYSPLFFSLILRLSISCNRIIIVITSRDKNLLLKLFDDLFQTLSINIEYLEINPPIGKEIFYVSLAELRVDDLFGLWNIEEFESLTYKFDLGYFIGFNWNSFPFIETSHIESCIKQSTHNEILFEGLSSEDVLLCGHAKRALRNKDRIAFRKKQRQQHFRSTYNYIPDFASDFNQCNVILNLDRQFLRTLNLFKDFTSGNRKLPAFNIPLSFRMPCSKAYIQSRQLVPEAPFLPSITHITLGNDVFSRDAILSSPSTRLVHFKMESTPGKNHLQSVKSIREKFQEANTIYIVSLDICLIQPAFLRELANAGTDYLILNLDHLLTRVPHQTNEWLVETLTPFLSEARLQKLPLLLELTKKPEWELTLISIWEHFRVWVEEILLLPETGFQPLSKTSYEKNPCMVVKNSYFFNSAGSQYVCPKIGSCKGNAKDIQYNAGSYPECVSCNIKMSSKLHAIYLAGIPTDEIHRETRLRQKEFALCQAISQKSHESVFRLLGELFKENVMSVTGRALLNHYENVISELKN